MLIQQQLSADGDPGVAVKMHTVERDGVTYHRLGVPFVAPTWAVAEGNLYVGLYPQVVEQAVTQARGAKAGGRSILDADHFKPIAGYLKDQPVSAVSFVDLQQTAPGAYEMNLMLTQSLTGIGEMMSGEPVAPMLPPLSKLEPMLGPAWRVAWADDAGFHVHSVSPFPGSQMFGPQGGSNLQMTTMGVGVMLPALGAARRTARQIQSSTQARGIHQAQVIWAQSNRGRYTDDISDLYENDMFTAEYVISPMDPVSVPGDLSRWPEDRRRAWIRQNSAYILVPGLTDDLDVNKIAVFLDPDLAGGGGTTVTYNDNSTSWETDLRAVDAQLKKQTGMTMAQLAERQRNFKPAGPEAEDADADADAPVQPGRSPAPAPR